MGKQHILIVLGTAREQRRSELVAKYVYNIAKSVSTEVELFDVKDHLHSATIPPWEDSPLTKIWKQKVEQSNVLIIVTPEYNHSIPGELKLLLDSALDEYKRKKVGIVGVSNGAYGGIRAIEVLKLILITLEMNVEKYTVNFSNVLELFDETGAIIDEAYEPRIKTLIEKLTSSN